MTTKTEQNQPAIDLAGMSPGQAIDAAAALWQAVRRPNQEPPAGDWNVWLILSGRGWGKTRCGCEQVRGWAQMPNTRIHIVARTAADARDTLAEGESGVLACCRFDIANPCEYEPSKRRIIWRNGSQATLFSAEQPDALRGPQCHVWLADELASWQYLAQTWANLQFGARLGDHTQGMITTTPRPIPLIKELIAESARPASRVFVTRGSTLDNAANLAPNAVAALRARYEGTRLGRQELNGEILDDNPGALWRRDDLDAYRVTALPALSLVVVGVDPAANSGADNAETGIVIAGRDAQSPPHYYILDDMSLGKATPAEWGAQAVAAYTKHRANFIAAERNNGGEMVTSTIRTVNADVAIDTVWASRGKATRAEPVSALSEQGRLHILGSLPVLEDQLVEWDPNPEVAAPSPDRLDAMVWAVTMLMGAQPASHFGVAEQIMGVVV